MAAQPLHDAARLALGLGPDDGLEAVERAFRVRAAALAGAAAVDPEASERLRLLIEARAALRAALTRPAAAPRRVLDPLGFRLSADGRDVEVALSLDALVALAEQGATEAWLDAPVLRRCAPCATRPAPACPDCAGAGVVRTARRRLAPLDLARLADGDMAVAASPWSDAVGRAAQEGPRLRAVLR